MTILISHKHTECKKLSMLSKEHLILSKYLKGSNIFPFFSYVRYQRKYNLVFSASYLPTKKNKEK